ncbi:MAG: gluconate 5-dehydrogenase [Meiothermus sp.]
MSVKELFDLSGKVALVTGGSRGLGLQIAEGLGEMGAKVALSSRKAEDLMEAAAHLKGLGVETLVFPADLSRPEAAEPLVRQVLERWGRIDILVNNAGATWGAPTAEHPLEAWDKVMNLNLRGVFLLTQAVGKLAMLPRRYGRIVNVASVAGLQGNHPQMMATLAYNTSKGGLVNFTRALAAEWAPHGVTVNAIAPGYFPTKMTRGTLEMAGELILQFVPMGRLGGPQDLKGLAVLLASDASAYITGQIIAVDGGISAI